MHQDLFSQAETLANLDSRRPKQVNLRRAVSAAYYAVFHFLVDEACRAQLGAQHQQAGYRDALARAFSHTAMRAACNSYRSGSLKPAVTKSLPLVGGKYSFPVTIRNLAGTFAELQEKRHLADYDRAERFQRSDVRALIEQAVKHVADFAQLPTSTDRTFFLSCLWTYKELANR
jgi:hypothetical protein